MSKRSKKFLSRQKDYAKVRGIGYGTSFGSHEITLKLRQVLTMHADFDKIKSLKSKGS